MGEGLNLSEPEDRFLSLKKMIKLMATGNKVLE